MNTFLYYVLVYVFLVAVWLIFCLIFYSISIISKKNLLNIPYGLTYIVNFLIGLYLSFYPIYLVWQVIKNKEWFFLVLIFIAGSFIYSIWSSIIGLLIVPFNLIVSVFVTKLGLILENNEKDFDIEYLSPEGKTIEKTSSESKQNRNLALFFLLSFINNLLYILLHPNQYSPVGLDYIFTPGFFMIQNALFFGIPFGIINLIKHKRFVYPSWKVFFTNLFKIELVITIGIQVLATIYYFLFS